MPYFYLIHQDGDLCTMTGYAYPGLQRALESAARHIGGLDSGRTTFHANRAIVKESASLPIHESPQFACHVVSAVGRPEMCRPGRMTIIAEEAVVMRIARCLSRRNGLAGSGAVLFSDLSPLPEETVNAQSSR